MMEVKNFPVYLDRNKLPNDAVYIVTSIRPEWKEEDIRFKIFTDGITNKLIGCYSKNHPSNIILVRIYGEKTDLFIDRAMEIKNFKLMNSKNYAPRLYATFNNGLVYDFIPGEILNINSCRDLNIYPLVATMLGKMHKLVYDSNIPKVSIVWDKCRCFINLIPEQYLCKEKQLKFIQNFPNGKNFLLKELTELQNILGISNNPVVFCHNDLLLANIIHRNDKSVMFIDYEYAGYNYQAFDIANHFAEFAGVSDFDCNLYPCEEFQLSWLGIYLKEFSGNGTVVSEKSLKQLYADVCKFSPLTHFFWSIWSLVQSHHSCIDFDYLKYAIIRFEEYKKLKNNIYNC